MHPFEKLQAEQREWAQKNFGDRPFWMPLLGMIEELGELDDAKNTDDSIDAMADVTIYMMDYCSSKEWKIETVIGWDHPTAMYARSFLSLAGGLARANLKRAQGIRGTNTEHDLKIMTTLAAIYHKMRLMAESNHVHLESQVILVWDRVVKKRDWTKNRINGQVTQVATVTPVTTVTPVISPVPADEKKDFISETLEMVAEHFDKPETD